MRRGNGNKNLSVVPLLRADINFSIGTCVIEYSRHSLTIDRLDFSRKQDNQETTTSQIQVHILGIFILSSNGTSHQF